MKIQRNYMAVLGAALLLGATACTKGQDYYDEGKYQDYVRSKSPIDSVDKNHTWQLTAEHTFRLTADAGENIQKVMLLTDNPLTTRNAPIINQTTLSDGETVTLSASVPTRLTGIYAALVDGDGKYYVQSIGVSQYTVSFKGVTASTPLSAPEPQAYNYLFEADLPLPGDYDYNDVVLRIAPERTGLKQVTLHVTLVAVGCTKQVAAYIRLLGHKFSDIESISTTTGKTFNDDLPQGSTFMVDNFESMLLSGRNGEAVVNLFADAHWAMNSSSTSADDYGMLTRKKYNTGSGDYMEYETKVWPTLSYVINFKSSTALNSFTQETLDPFIVTQYNIGLYETHQDYLRSSQALYQYSLSSALKDLPWALKVPMKDFRYPLEGVEIGFRKHTDTGVAVMFGAYVTPGHSFGQWAEDCETSLDWYRYPDTDQVW